MRIGTDLQLPFDMDRRLRQALDSTFRKVAGAVNELADTTPIALTDAATVSVDAGTGNTFRVVLTGNRTLANPTNLTDGQQLFFRIKQDGTGSRTLAYGSMYKFPGGVAPTLSTGAGDMDILSCQYDKTDNTLVCVFNADFS